MDILIELIVWFFKAILGDEGQAKKRTQQNNSPATPQRGPYNYGDGRPAAPGIANRPPTLEEILEQVKRQQQSAKQPQAPAPKARTTTPSQQSQSTQPKIPAAERQLRSSIEDRQLQPRLVEKEVAKIAAVDRKFDALNDREERFRPLSEQSVTGKEATTAAYSDANTAVKAGQQNFGEFFKTMRTAPAATRIEMARRAYVFSIVFGPPKAKTARSGFKTSRFVG